MADRPSSGSPTLLLVPTGVESMVLTELGGLEPGLAIEERAGFGPIAAAACTASILARLRPARVLLLGIAGTYDTANVPVGSAIRLGRVEVDGLETAGFEQAPGVGTGIVLAGKSDPALLVTVLAASSSLRQAEERRQRHPGAVAEDMEGFGVALACALARVPLAIVRGISNAAGERDRKCWRIHEAMSAARVTALELLRRRDWGATG